MTPLKFLAIGSYNRNRRCYQSALSNQIVSLKFGERQTEPQIGWGRQFFRSLSRQHEQGSAVQIRETGSSTRNNRVRVRAVSVVFFVMYQSTPSRETIKLEIIQIRLNLLSPLVSRLLVTLN